MFFITRTQPGGKSYAVRDEDGDWRWTPSKMKATRFTSDEADIIAHQFGKYSEQEVQVVGAGKEAA